MADEPSKTLYVSNLSDRLKLPGARATRCEPLLTLRDLRRVLYTLFAAHGRVLDIVAKRRDGMRGQAFVVFDSVQAATSALRREDGHVVLGKPLRVSFARAVSHATVLAEEGPERLYQLKLGLVDSDVGRRKVTVSSAQNTAEAMAAAKRAREAAERGEGEEDEEDDDEAPDPTRIKLGGDDDAMEENDSDSDVDAQPLRPHHVLHVRDLPQVTDAMLQVLFQQCALAFRRIADVI